MSKSNPVPAPHRSILPLVLIAAGVLVLAGVLFAILRGGTNPDVSTTTAGAHLTVDKTEVNLGDVKLGKTVEAAFTITNTGDAPLRFDKPPFIEVKKGC